MGNSASEYPSSDSPVTGSSSNEQEYPNTSRADEFRELNANLPAEFSSKYQAVSKIGSGSFGSVYKVRDHRTKAIYAAKMVDLHHHNTQSEVINKIILSTLTYILSCKPSRAQLPL